MADIGAKLKVEGESSFSKAMRDAAKNTRSLNSELKLAEAEFKASGDAQKLYTDKAKLLKQQLSEQEKAVQAATSMLQALATAGYDANSTKVMEWRAKLANAKAGVLEINQAIAENDAALQKSADGYDDLGESMQETTADAQTAKVELGKTETGAVSLKEALSKIGINLGWEGLNRSLNEINQKIDASIKRAVQLGKALWDAGVDATVWADDLITLSKTTGVDPKTLQQWQYAARFVDVSVDTITSSQNKLLMQMKSTSKEAALSFNELGVTTRNADGELRPLTDVFWDSIEALGRIDNETQRDAMAMNLFGKSARELNPLLEAGREEWEKYADAAPVISQEKVDSLGNANDAIEDMNAQLEALKLDVLAEMAPTIEQVASAVSSAASSVREFMATEEGQQALTRLQTAVSGLIESFTEQDFGKILSDASDDIVGLIDGLSGIIENKDGVVGALEAIGAGIVALKVAEAVTQVGKLIAQLKLLKGMSVIESAGKTAGGAAASSAGKAGGNIFSSVLGSPAAKVLGGLFVGVGEFFRPLMEQEKNAGERAESAKEVASADDEVAKKAESLGQTMAQAEATIASNMHEWGVDAETAKAMYLSGDYDDAPKSNVFEEVDTTKAQEVITLTEEQAAAAQKYWDIVRQGVTIDQEAKAYQDLFDAFSDSDESIAKLDTLMGIIDALPASMEQLPGISETTGANVSVGLANGIAAHADAAITAASNLASAVSATIAGALQIASPSKVMEQYGEFVGAGFAMGIENSAVDVARASESVIGGLALRAPAINAPAVQQVSSGSDSGMAGLILNALSQMRVQIDGHDAGQIMLPTLEELMGEQTISRRYEA